MHRPARQVREAMLGLEGELFFKQRLLYPVQKRPHLPRRKAPPLRAAGILEVGAVGAPGEMHAREKRAELLAMRSARVVDRAPGEAGDERRRLAVKTAEVLVREIGDRRGAGNAVARKVRHEIEVERKLVGGQPLE